MNNKIKVPYEVLALEVEKLYPPYYTLKPGETVEDHIFDIIDFIESCGWTAEEFIEQYIHRAINELQSELFPEKMN